MAKKDVLTPQETLSKLVAKYGQEKEILDKYKKSTDADNKQIKTIMIEAGLETFDAGGYQAKYSVSKSESYDEDALIEYIHKHKALEVCIKTEEHVDEDVLEDLIYKGKISKTEVAALDKFRIVKETPKLTIKKVGK